MQTWASKPTGGVRWLLDSSNPLTSGLQVMWLANEGSGTLLQNMGSLGPTLDGGFYNTPTWESGRDAWAVRMDGSSDYAKAPLDGEDYSAYTIEFLYRTTTAPSEDGLFQWAQALSSGTPWVLVQGEDATTTRVFVSTGYRQDLTVAVGEWQHVVVTGLEGGGGAGDWWFYLNGNFIDTYSGVWVNAQANADDLYIGNGYNGYAAADFDLFRLWDRVLTATQIQSLYSSPWQMVAPIKPWYMTGVATATPYYYNYMNRLFAEG